SLTEEGISVWWDRFLILGVNVNIAIEQAVQNARAMVVTMIPQAGQSQGVSNDIRLAKQFGVVIRGAIFREDRSEDSLITREDLYAFDLQTDFEGGLISLLDSLRAVLTKKTRSVFIAYSRHDMEFAQRFSRDLQENGYDAKLLEHIVREDGQTFEEFI